MALPFNANHFAIYQALVNAGYPTPAAAGVVGNAMAESYPDIRPSAFNPAGGGQGALGIFQWRGSRQSDLKALAAKRGVDVKNLDVQISQLLNELSGAGNDPQSAKAGQMLKDPNLSPEAASTIFEKYFERAGGAGLEQRQRYARAFFDHLNSRGNQMAAGGERDMLAPPVPPPSLPPSSLDMASMGAGLGDMMVTPEMLEGVAPMGATEMAKTAKTMMDIEPKDDGFSMMISPNAGLASLAEALIAHGTGRPMNTERGAEIGRRDFEKFQEQEQKQRTVEWLASQGHEDLAEAMLAGMDEDTAFRAYEGRIGGGKQIPDIEKFKHYEQMVRAGHPMAEQFGRVIGAIDKDGKLPANVETALWYQSATPEQRAAWEATQTPDTITAMRTMMSDPELAQFHLDTKRAGATNIDLSQKEDVKYSFKRMEVIDEKADTAESIKHRFSTMETLLDTNSMETGRLQEMLLPIKEVLADVGIYVGEDLTAQQFFDRLAKGGLPSMMSDAKGAVSDFESRIFMSSMASMGNEEDTNRMLLQAAQKTADRVMFRRDFMRDYIYENEGSLRGFEAAFKEASRQQFGDELNMFKKLESAADLADKAPYMQPGEMYFIKDGTGKWTINRWMP